MIESQRVHAEFTYSKTAQNLSGGKDMALQKTNGDFKVKEGDIIFAYGFDAAGFPARHETLDLGRQAQVEFLDFYSPTSLDSADGVIIPQGIFEKLQSRTTAFRRRTIVSVDKIMLLERERQVLDLLRAGKWICFLVGDIVDEVSEGLHLEPINDTDLCKRILNSFMVGRHHRYRFYIDNPPEVVVREPDFETYVRNFGTPTTVFTLPEHDPIERTVIAELGDHPVGFEFDAQLFFLPFALPVKSGPAETSTIKAVTRAIIGYRRKRAIEAPSWVNAFKFKSEEKLYLKINSLLEEVNALESELRSWNDYKTIVATNGENLHSKIIAILRSVFELHVNDIAALGIATVSDHDLHSVVMLETQSAAGSVGKDAIDQIDQRRTRAGLSKSTPAILFINSDMTIENVMKRAERAVPAETINYAKNLNVMIIRTIDLLLLMRQLENAEARGELLMTLLLSHRGWLKAAQEEVPLPTGT